jgi:hypothetical protein
MSDFETPISLQREYGSGPASEQLGAACPSVSLDCLEVLKFPEDGLVTFRFKRGQIVARSATRSKPASASCTLELTKLCSVEEAEPEELPKEEEARDNPIDRLFESALEDEPEAE